MSVPTDGGPEPQTLDEILDWHQGIVDALVAQRAAVLRAAREGASVPSRFVGLTGGELDAYYDSRRQEVETGTGRRKWNAPTPAKYTTAVAPCCTPGRLEISGLAPSRGHVGNLPTRRKKSDQSRRGAT